MKKKQTKITNRGWIYRICKFLIFYGALDFQALRVSTRETKSQIVSKYRFLMKKRHINTAVRLNQKIILTNVLDWSKNYEKKAKKNKLLPKFSWIVNVLKVYLYFFLFLRYKCQMCRLLLLPFWVSLLFKASLWYCGFSLKFWKKHRFLNLE